MEGRSLNWYEYYLTVLQNYKNFTKQKVVVAGTNFQGDCLVSDTSEHNVQTFVHQRAQEMDTHRS